VSGKADYTGGDGVDAAGEISKGFFTAGTRASWILAASAEEKDSSAMTVEPSI
jgi:hypothetical protein